MIMCVYRTQGVPSCTNIKERAAYKMCLTSNKIANLAFPLIKEPHQIYILSF